MKKVIVYTSIVQLMISSLIISCNIGHSHIIESPDNHIKLSFDINPGGKPYYIVWYDNEQIMDTSFLGVIREDGDYSNKLSIISISGVKEIYEDYEMLHGKQRKINYTAQERDFRLKAESGGIMEIIFRISNDGLAFRYFFPGKSKNVKRINEEISSFNFFSGTRAWLHPQADAKTGWCNTQPSYEEHYYKEIPVGTPSPFNAGWSFPALFNYKKYWYLISEASVDNHYCGSRLCKESPAGNYKIGFPQEEEHYLNGPVNPQSRLPWYSPWRIIAIGDDLGDIVESTLGTDLAEPAVNDNVSYIKPGKASWSWVLLNDASVTYPVQKEFIDYAADMGWEYCLIDVNWDRNIGYDSIKLLADYAADKNVGLFLWYNSSGNWNKTTYTPKGLLTERENRRKEFQRISEMGIKGIKVDFWPGDGQSAMGYYIDLFNDAAGFQLLVNCHGSTIPRGWHRTYPNLMTMEAVKGYEFLRFDQNNTNQEPDHCCILPFTRNVFDPMDFTPMCFDSITGKSRVTTKAFELALPVIQTSGIMNFAEIPAGMAKQPEYIMEFLDSLPDLWDEIQFIDGYPGKYIVITRRAENTWYVAGINGEQDTLKLNISIPVLPERTKAIMITDNKELTGFERIEFVISNREFDITLEKYGGFVCVIQ